MPDVVEIITSNPVIEIIGASSVVEIVEVGPAGPPIADGTYGELLVTNSGSKFWPGWEYEDRAALALATVPSIITRIYVRYYSAATQLGGAHYKSVASQPAHDLWVQDASGKYFEIDESIISPTMAGGIGDDSTDDTDALVSCFEYCSLTGRTLDLQDYVFRTTQYLQVTSGFNLIGNWMNDVDAAATPTPLRGAIRYTGAQVSAAIASMSVAAQIVVGYSGSDVFANGDRVGFVGVGGMKDMEGREAIVSDLDAGANTFKLKEFDGTTYINSSTYAAWTSGGTIFKARYVVEVKAATAGERVHGFQVDGVALNANNISWGALLMSSTGYGHSGFVYIDRARGKGVMIDSSNGALNSGTRFRFIRCEAGSNANAKYMIGVDVFADNNGITKLKIDEISAGTQQGDGVRIGDCDDTFIGTVSGGTDDILLYPTLRLRGEPGAANLAYESGNSRAARKVRFGWFSGGGVYAEDGSKCIIDWVNSEGTRVDCEAGASLDYKVIDRINGRRYASFRHVMDDEFDALGEHSVITGSPALGLITGNSKTQALMFDGIADEGVQWNFIPPRTWKAGKITKVKLVLIPMAAGGGANSRWKLETKHILMGGTMGNMTTTETFTIAVGATSERPQIETLTMAVPQTIQSRECIVNIRLTRLASSDAGDNFTNGIAGHDIGLVGKPIIYFVNNAVDSDNPDYRYEPSDIVATNT